MTVQPIGAALDLLADRDPDRTAVHEMATGTTLSRRDVATRSAAVAAAWSDDVAPGDLVGLHLGNTADLVVGCVAVWRLGATPLPLPPEPAAALDVADPALVVGTLPDRASGRIADRAPASAWKATATGGSTGPPKVVLSTGAATVDPDADVAPYLPREQVQLVSGPLHHSAPFTYALRGLMTGHTLVLLERFSPTAVLTAIPRFGVTWALLVPSMLHRLARHPDVGSADLGSLRHLVHLGAPCPPDLKRWWLERIGAERVVEVYASSESAGITMIRGDEWLAAPGSVGRPVGGSSFRVVDAHGGELPAGEVGEVIMTRTGGPRYRYLGGTARRMPGWEDWDALGDLGWLDDEGRLFLVDRADDVIRRDGHDVHPARVEAALERHPAVRSAAVFELHDGVHALLDLDREADPDAVVAAADLPPWAVPTGVEVVDGPLRDDAGKVRRSALRAERLTAGGGSARPGS
ncbi:class I adenylate-forming enzyme family protein [Actinomycetospora chiangmaiensis]|uniref:class I adenylate-forming enzyme family protein n=1 Tax=Actinomycetospora chiangmaiensis TaxID=402650 RepID=UPI000361AB33|nr:AMP-binding protein [Actinomycetospora chiangmaiensis]